MSFPGATAPRSEASYAIFGAPLDATTSFQPGTRFGPDRIRQFAAAFADYHHHTESHFSDLGVHDAGDLRAWPDVREYLAFLSGELGDAVAEGLVPVTIGGEHTVTYAGVEATSPDTVVVVDAHLDLRDRFDDDPWSHACVTRRVLELADEAVVIGARTGSSEEWDRAARADVTVVPPADTAAWLDTAPETLADNLYLSVDIDGADPGFAPGTGTLEPFGLTPQTIRAVVRAVAPRAVGFDVVEVNDRDDGQTAALGGKLLREFVHSNANADETETESHAGTGNGSETGTRGRNENENGSGNGNENRNGNGTAD
ncbi:MAG: agmatinase [Halorubrum sp. J07HR59]|nr:MAG: agmatinase [Halorubrum sp. J07HR59]